MNARPLATTGSPAEHIAHGTPHRQEGLRVAIVTPQPLMRDLLARWLGRLGAAGAISALGDGDELRRLIEAGQRFHLVVAGCLGADWPRMLAALPDRAHLAGIPVIIVPERDDPELIAAALRHGVSGIVPTSLDPELAAAAVRLVLNGGTYVPVQTPPATSAPWLESPAIAALTGLGLTRREAEVVLYLQEGCSNRTIAAALGISESTVVVHVRKLMHKLSATNRAQAVYLIHQRLHDQARPVPGRASPSAGPLPDDRHPVAR